MAKRKKKDAACELVAYRFYGVPSEQDAAQEDKTFGCCRYLEADAGGTIILCTRRSAMS